MSEFIEFSVNDPQRFQRLKCAFDELKKDKNSGTFRSDEDWPKLFDSAALDCFSWQSAEGRRQWLDDSQHHPILVTPTEDATGLRWDFFSMIDAFRNGEYELRSCELVASGKGRMEFFAFAYPYGGVGCMVALIESFGFKVIGIEDGTGYQSFE